MATEESSAGEASGKVTFHIKSASDSRYTLTMSTTATVADLKQKLSTPEFAGIPEDRLRLIYSGRVMKDSDTIGSYKIKDGNTVHLVKGAASNQQRNPETAGQSTSSQVPPSAGVPQNLATGTGSDPLAGLTGARYAGFAQMPGAGMFGPDGGVSRQPLNCISLKRRTLMCHADERLSESRRYAPNAGKSNGSSSVQRSYEQPGCHPNASK